MSPNPLPPSHTSVWETHTDSTLRTTERFFDRFAATGFAIPGHPHHVGRVVWNRIRSSEVDVGGRKSRVLLISGPPALVNEVALCNYLAGKISYQIESVRTVAHATVSNPSTAALLGLHTDGANEQRALMEFRFGSYRCQSESARMALTREFKEFGVFCEFGKFLSLAQKRSSRAVVNKNNRQGSLRPCVSQRNLERLRARGSERVRCAFSVGLVW